MARTSLCAKLMTGQDTVCVPPKRRYFQQAVIINRDDIDSDSVEITTTDYDADTPTCSYNVKFELESGKTGYFFQGPETGSNFFGSFDKSQSDLGFVQYTHNASILIVGATEAAKCILDSLSKGSFVVAFQFTDGTVEIYGMQNGLVAADYTYDVQGGGGGTAIVLSSPETAPEFYVPLIYVSQNTGQESEDFDSAFSNIPST